MTKLLNNTATGSSLAEFKWSSTEQVYPFEKNSNNETLYAKEIVFSSIVAGWNSVAHGLSSIKMHKMMGVMLDNPWFGGVGCHGPIPNVLPANPASIGILLDNDTLSVNLYVGSGFGGGSAKIQIIYSK